MKDYALELAAKQSGMNAKLNIMREYLQAYALRIMQDEGIFSATAFIGGTSLRFLHGLPRFSEDLNFSAAKGKKPVFASLMKKIKEEFSLAGYDVTVTFNDEKTVNSAFIRIAGLMKDAGISALAEQKLSIKIEIDTNPPEGAVKETQIVNKYFPFSFLSYDTASLFAGKFHALLSRDFIKGRDFFDLGWYLSRWKDLVPNLALLRAALKQTGWKGPAVTAGNWREILYKAVKEADWKKVRRDVENFLENPSDREVFTQENVLGLLK